MINGYMAAHLRFLRERTLKGDILSGEDMDFVDNAESDVKDVMKNIEIIKERTYSMIENC